MKNKELFNLVGVIFIYLAVFGLDYYIVNTLHIEGISYLAYYMFLLIIGIYFVFYKN
jgi:hypothetical protein